MDLVTQGGKETRHGFWIRRLHEIKKQNKEQKKVNNKRDMKRTKAPCIDLSPRITIASTS